MPYEHVGSDEPTPIEQAKSIMRDSRLDKLELSKKFSFVAEYEYDEDQDILTWGFIYFILTINQL